MPNPLRLFVCLFTLQTAALAGASPAKPIHRPATGYVPDETTAIRIAVAAWEPIYGPKTIAREKPCHAALKAGVWTVEGSLPRGQLGGGAVAEIRQSDGCLLRVSHGR